MMNKFEKKAMAKRAYRALVKTGWSLPIPKQVRDYLEKRPTPGMMTRYEFERNGSRTPSGFLPNDPKLPLGLVTSWWHNTARYHDIPESDYTNRELQHHHHLDYPVTERPYGPLFSPEATIAREEDYYSGRVKNPITGLTPWSEYRLTGDVNPGYKGPRSNGADPPLWNRYPRRSKSYKSDK